MIFLETIVAVPGSHCRTICRAGLSETPRLRDEFEWEITTMGIECFMSRWTECARSFYCSVCGLSELVSLGLIAAFVLLAMMVALLDIKRLRASDPNEPGQDF